MIEQSNIITFIHELKNNQYTFKDSNKIGYYKLNNLIETITGHSDVREFYFKTIKLLEHINGKFKYIPLYEIEIINSSDKFNSLLNLSLTRDDVYVNIDQIKYNIKGHQSSYNEYSYNLIDNYGNKFLYSGDPNKPIGKRLNNLATDNFNKLLLSSLNTENVYTYISEKKYKIEGINEGFGRYDYILIDESTNRFRYSGNPENPIGQPLEKLNSITSNTRKEQINDITSSIDLLLGTLQRSDKLQDIFNDMRALKEKYNIYN